MKVLALLIWPLFFITTFFLFNKAKLSIFNKTYSNLGSNIKYGKMFNFILVITGLIQLLFLTYVLVNNKSQYSIIGVMGLSSLIVTTIAGIFTGIIAEHHNEKIHMKIAIIGFTGAIIGYPLYGLYLFNANYSVGVFMLIWGLIVMPYQAYRHMSGKKIYAINEVFMFLGAFFTNIALVWLYF